MPVADSQSSTVQRKIFSAMAVLIFAVVLWFFGAKRGAPPPVPAVVEPAGLAHGALK